METALRPNVRSIWVVEEYDLSMRGVEDSHL